MIESPIQRRDFLEEVFAEQPVLLRGAALDFKMRKEFKKTRFLKKWGKTRLEASRVPYGKSYGLPHEEVSKLFRVRFSGLILTLPPLMEGCSRRIR